MYKIKMQTGIGELYLVNSVGEPALFPTYQDAHIKGFEMTGCRDSFEIVRHREEIKMNVQDLIDQGLVVKKSYDDKGLHVLKYHRKVFYNNLWHLDDRLMECRGLVVDDDWNVIVKPWRKVFNVGENNTTIDPDGDYYAIEKINGFMFNITVHPDFGVICSTSGTLEGTFVDYGKEMFEKHLGYPVENLKDFGYGTFLFECCHPDDEHVVNEQEGLCLLGVRFGYGSELDNDILVNPRTLSEFTATSAWFENGRVAELIKNVENLYLLKGSEVLNLQSSLDNEGVMVYDAHTHQMVAKLKTHSYLCKKFFMRIGTKAVDKLFNNPDNVRQRIDEEYYPLLDFILESYTADDWRKIEESDRKKIIENFLNKV